MKSHFTLKSGKSLKCNQKDIRRHFAGRARRNPKASLHALMMIGQRCVSSIGAVNGMFAEGLPSKIGIPSADW